MNSISTVNTKTSSKFSRCWDIEIIFPSGSGYQKLVMPTMTMVSYIFQVIIKLSFDLKFGNATENNPLHGLIIGHNYFLMHGLIIGHKLLP